MNQPSGLSRLLLVAFLILGPSSIASAQPMLVADLNTLAGGVVGSEPHGFVTLGDRVVFSAFEPATGRELWASDGTPEGTVLLADAGPGPADPLEDASGPLYVGVGGGLLYWASPELGAFGPSVLWRTDGTPEGTFSLLRYASLPQPRGSVTSAASGRHFFLACDPGAAGQLWTSDGTAAGTRRVSELPADRDCTSADAEMVLLGERVFFRLSRPDRGEAELWTSDGSAAGTRAIETFLDLRGLVASAQALFFEARTGRGWELWASDGTPRRARVASAFRDRDPFRVQTGIVNFELYTPVVLGERAIVVSHDNAIGLGLELRVCEGPGSRARPLTDVGSAGASLGPNVPQVLAQIDDAIVFVADSGGYLAGDYELWRTDGTPQSTAQVLDLCPGPCSGIDLSAAHAAVVLGERLYFRGDDGSGGGQLWASDGTAAGTLEVQPGEGDFAVLSEPMLLAGEVYFVASTPASGEEIWKVSPATPFVPVRVSDLAAPEPFPRRFDSLLPLGEFLGAAAGKVFFAAADGEHGSELWTSEGSAATTALTADVAREQPASAPRSLIDLGERAIFTAYDGVAEGVWASQGSTATTVRLTPQDPTSPCGAQRPGTLTRALGAVFFRCERDVFETDQIWRTDGTAAGTVLVTELAEPMGVRPFLWTPLEDKLYFPVFTGMVEEIWQTDGTAAGTGRAFGLEDATSTNLEGMVASTEALWAATGVFDPETEQFQSRLWRSDGTQAGTTLLLEPAPGAFIGASQLLTQGETLWLIVANAEGSALWRSDGSAAGTVEIAELGPVFVADLRAFGSGVALLVYHVDALFQPVDLALWTSDGTGAGTLQVAEVGRLSSTAGVFGTELTVVGEQIFFHAEDDEHGAELWVSDGTAGGTRIVRDLVPGPGFGHPTGLTAAGGKLFFSATDGVSGLELWESDGTAEGTRRVSDLRPGMLSSVPTELAQVGSRLYWSADDGVHGRELWSLGFGGL